MRFWLFVLAACSTAWSAHAQETDGRVWVGVGPSPLAYEQQTWTIEDHSSQTRISLKLGLENEASVAVGYGVGAWVFAGQLTAAHTSTEDEIADVQTTDARTTGPSWSLAMTTLSLGPLVRYVLGGSTLRPFSEVGVALGIHHTSTEQRPLETESNLMLASASVGLGSMLRLSDRVSLDALLRAELSTAWGEQRLPGIYSDVTGAVSPTLGTRSFDTTMHSMQVGLALRLSVWL